MWFIPIFIPLVVAFVILVSPAWNITNCNRREIHKNRKKFIILIASSFIFSSISSGILWGISIYGYYDNEIWNNKIVKIGHEERWTEKEQRSRQVPDGVETYYTGTGKNRTSHTRTKYRTEYYYVTETYGPYFYAFTDGHEKIIINKSKYDKWKITWNNEKKTGEHNGSASGFNTPITGGIFESYWPETFKTTYPYSSIHKYKNKVRHSSSIMNFGKPNKELAKKYPRPSDVGNMNPSIGYGGKNYGDIPYLRKVNATLGKRYQIHTLVVFLKNRSEVTDILTAWQGPNKNELVTFVGMDSENVKWCEVYSWLDNTTIHGEISNVVMGMGQFNSEKYGNALLELVPKLWRRKQFEDFDYIKEDISVWWTLSAVLVSIILCTITAIIIQFKID